MAKRVQITSSQLRAGVGMIVTHLLKGNEVVLTHHGAPIGVIRRWTEADETPKPRRAVTGKVRPREEAPKGTTDHLKPTFASPLFSELD